MEEMSRSTDGEEERHGDLEIPHDQWLTFLDGFSRQHMYWRATVEVASAAGRLVVVEERRLHGVSIDRAASVERAYVQFGEPQKEHVTHTVSNPVHITFKQSSSGEYQGLEIASSDGTTTVIRFRSMMGPEMLDGIAV